MDIKKRPRYRGHVDGGTTLYTVVYVKWLSVVLTTQRVDEGDFCFVLFCSLLDVL